MKKSKHEIKAIVVCGALFASSFANISYAASCADVWQLVTHSFSDYNGVISDDSKLQLQLLADCTKIEKFCVIGERPSAGRYEIISGDTIEALGKNKKGLISVSGTAIVHTRKYENVCVLVRYSGGSAAAWLTKAWALNVGNPARLNTDNVEINGDTLSPSELMNDVIAKVPKIK
ncbi:MAG: hypothetical protein ACJ8LG_23055 [Massilia sp.]